MPKFSIAEELRRQQPAPWHDSEAMEWGADGSPKKLKLGSIFSMLRIAESALSFQIKNLRCFQYNTAPAFV